MDLPILWLWSGLHIGPQLMDGLSAGRSPPRIKEEEEWIKVVMIYATLVNTQAHGFDWLQAELIV